MVCDGACTIRSGCHQNPVGTGFEIQGGFENSIVIGLMDDLAGRAILDIELGPGQGNALDGNGRRVADLADREQQWRANDGDLLRLYGLTPAVVPNPELDFLAVVPSPKSQK